MSAMVQETPKAEDSGAPVDPMRLAMALWQRRWTIAGSAILGIGAGAGLAKTLVPAVFEARSVIECDRCSGPDFGDRELATLQETVKLPQHIERARSKLGLAATLEQLGKNLDVNASIESRLIQVTARAKSGTEAAALANAIVEAFVETRQQVEQTKLDDRMRTLQVDLENAKLAVVDARTRYDRFRTENGIADLPAERQAAIHEAARLRSEAAIARAEEQAEQARALALRRASSKEPSTAILQQTDDLPDAKRLALARAELISARARLSADHPRVLALAAEVEMLEQRVAASNDPVTIGRTVGRNPQWELAQQGILQANAGQEAASKRQSAYEKLADSAANAVGRLSSIEGRASELLSNLQNAERHLSSIDLDLKLARDAARAPQIGLRILAEARVPSAPMKSSRRVVAVLGPLVGFVMAVLVVLLRELRGGRVHTAAELCFWGQGPVIVASPWPRDPNAIDDLISDLVRPLERAVGKTVVIGASTHERHSLHTLREQMGNEIALHSVEWLHESPDSAPALRRIVRDADRVLVVTDAGAHSAFALRALSAKLGCPGRIGFVLLNVHASLVSLPDQSGDVEAFWNNGPGAMRSGRRSAGRRSSPSGLRRVVRR